MAENKKSMFDYMMEKDGYKPSDLSELLGCMVLELVLALDDDHRRVTGHDPSKHYIECTACMYLRKLMGSAQKLDAT